MSVRKAVCIAGVISILALGALFTLRGRAAESVRRSAPSPWRQAVSAKFADSGDQTSKPTNLQLVEPRETLRLALKNYETALAVVANNIVNAETSGFKASRVIWEDNSYRHEASAGIQDSDGNRSPNSCSVGTGCRAAAIQIDFRQGRLKRTDCELDLAIDGDGFFQVTDPSSSSTYYYRGGRFGTNVNGQLVVSAALSGRLLEPATTIPSDATAILVSPEGMVSVKRSGSDQRIDVGLIQLASFTNPQGLERMGENLFAQTDGSGLATIGSPGHGRLGKIRQGWIESSNADLGMETAEWNRLRRLGRTIQTLLDEKL